ncbi:MAG: phosphatase PAP2 family protein [Ruminococcus flavefaciens]|nr:phosphatase PAP2 family protein [Ruminococcus flavefaciens]
MDIEYLLFLQKIREAFGGVLDGFMLKATALGESTITFLLLAFVYWCVDKHAGQAMAFNVSIACTWNQFLKWACRIDRPWIRDERIIPVQAAIAGAGGYSFPSGHTARAAAVWGALGTALIKRKERIAAVLCWTVLLIIAFSRNYLGVHTPQDVIVSLAIGVILILLVEKVLQWVEKGNNRDIIVTGIGCLACFLPMLRAGCLSNAGAGMGFFIGWLIERRFIQFKTEDTCAHKCVKFVIGGTGIVFILEVVRSALGLVLAGKYAGFFSSFILTVFIMAVYPFFFCKKSRYKAGILLAAILSAGTLAFSAWRTRANWLEESSAAEQQVQNMQQAEEYAVEIIAHRGYSSVFPENTLAAFAGALDIGADYIELDVQLSKDGEVVILHDESLKRTTGIEGTTADFTCEELKELDAGSWFDSSFAGEKLPTLSEALELIGNTECKVYLELKDIGDKEGFEEAVLESVSRCGMEEQCVFASFRYEYLRHLKELDDSLQILYNTSSGTETLVEEFPADYYGLAVDAAAQENINAIHEAGKKAFVWTVNTPAQMQEMQRKGVDGIVTNYPGVAKVICHPEYEYLVENFVSSFALPGLYEPDLPEKCDSMVVQGFTKTQNEFVVSAYSKTEGQSSILYIMDSDGKLMKIVDLKFTAHTGGIAYDKEHDLLWVTGPEGKVYAISWSSVMADTYQGETQAEFDAGLVNHNGGKVASFLSLFEGELFVGSYVDGAAGKLNRYDLSDVKNPRLLSSVSIPERIQGITFKREGESCYMWLSQGYQTEDSHLLKFSYREETSGYTEPLESHVLPEGAEQIQTADEGMYILFESAARPYRETARIPNDQIYLVKE